MGLLYKPNALYMSPSNSSIDITDGINFSFVFRGYKLINANGYIYENTADGEWQLLLGTNSFAFDFTSPQYNNAQISKSIDTTSALYTAINSKANSTLGWGVQVYGESMTSTVTVANQITSSILGYETGNQVVAYQGGTTTPFNNTYISSYSSKLLLPTTNDDNTFTISESVYINLTSGDSIQTGVDTTKYYLYKINEGTEQTVYKIQFYATQAEAEAGSGTVISGSVLQNNTYYVDAVTSTTNIFYVGILAGNIIQLYNTKEGALQGATEMIVPLTVGVSITIQGMETSQIVTFVPIVANSLMFTYSTLYSSFTITGGEDGIYDYSGITLHTGQRVYVIDSSPLEVYYIRVWDSSTLSLYSNREAAMNNNSVYLINPTSTSISLYLAEIMQAKQQFTPDWTDTNNIPLIEYWDCYLYNSTGVLLEQSDINYNANITYKFEHLLISFLNEYSNANGIYGIRFVATDNNGYVYDTGIINIDVGYSVSHINYQPITTMNNCDSSITIDWSSAKSIQGTVSDSTGGNPTFTSNYLYNNNTAMNLPANSKYTFNTAVPQGCIPTFFFQPSSSTFTGDIVTLDGSTQRLTISYSITSGSNGVFTLTLVNYNTSEIFSKVISTDVNTLNANHIYLIGAYSNTIYIRDFKTV